MLVISNVKCFGSLKSATCLITLWWDETTQSERLTSHPLPPALTWPALVAKAKEQSPNLIPIQLEARND